MILYACTDLASEGSTPVPAIKLDLVPEAKSPDQGDQKVEKVANSNTSPSRDFKFTPCMCLNSVESMPVVRLVFQVMP